MKRFRLIPLLLAAVLLGAASVSYTHLAAVFFSIKPAQRKAWQQVSNKNSNLNAYLQESINGMRVTQIFTREDVNYTIFERLAKNARKSWMKAVYISNLMWVSVDNISQIVTSLLYVVGVLVCQPAISFGTDRKSVV